MRRLIFTLVTFVALTFVPAASHAQGSPIFGNATILYSVDEEVLKATDPLSIRMAVNHSCLHDRGLGKGNSLRELFEKITEGMPPKERVILQVALLFGEGDAVCAAFWFAYIEK